MNDWWLMSGGAFIVYWTGLVVGAYLVGRFAIKPKKVDKYGEKITVQTGDEWYWAAIFWPLVVIAAVPGFILAFPLWWAQKRAREQRLMAIERKRKL